MFQILKINEWINFKCFFFESKTNNYQEKLNAALANKDVTVIKLSMNYPNVDKAKDIINKLVEVYNADAVNDKNAESRKTAEFIEERIANVGRDLGNVELQKEQFKKANQITDLARRRRIGLKTSAGGKSETIEIASQLELTNSLISLSQDKEIIKSFPIISV